MPALSDLLSWLDNKRRVVGRNMSDLVTDPSGYLSMTAANIPQTIAEQGSGMAPMGLAGIFIGKGAATWDAAAMGRAQQMAKEGADPRVVWKETGTWQGPDGAWRQEIPDNTAMFNTSTIGGKKIENDLTVGNPGFDLGGTIGNLIEHPRLGSSYPDLTKSTFIGNKNTFFGDGAQGAFDNGVLTINAPAKAVDAKSTALHELQHAIQQREGWAQGGSSDMAFRDPRMWGKDGAQGSEVAREMLKQKMTEMATPLPIEAYAKSAWGASQVTPEIKRAYANYVRTIKGDAGRFSTEAQQTVAKEWYRRLAGEAEARATQARMPMDAAQRRAVFPEDSYDVPMDQLILRRPLNDLLDPRTD